MVFTVVNCSRVCRRVAVVHIWLYRKVELQLFNLSEMLCYMKLRYRCLGFGVCLGLQLLGHCDFVCL
jgi:hypothetical protein